WKSVGTVAVTRDTTGLNVTLAKGFALKGSVTRNGAAVDGVLVNVWSNADNMGGSAVTNSKGEFVLKGLSNATYRVDVWTPDGSASHDAVTVNGADVSGVTLSITKASGAITGKITDKSGAVAGGALVLAYDQTGVEKDRCLTDKNSGACTLDGLTVGGNYTIQVFGNAKVKSGSWTTDSGYATGSAQAGSPAATLELKMN
ncbi:MAG: carboxypeptidase-like regulatory domain-containing protein, partial [Magnetococcus sp. YQC-9]